MALPCARRPPGAWCSAMGKRLRGGVGRPAHLSLQAELAVQLPRNRQVPRGQLVRIRLHRAQQRLTRRQQSLGHHRTAARRAHVLARTPDVLQQALEGPGVRRRRLGQVGRHQMASVPSRTRRGAGEVCAGNTSAEDPSTGGNFRVSAAAARAPATRDTAGLQACTTSPPVTETEKGGRGLGAGPEMFLPVRAS